MGYHIAYILLYDSYHVLHSVQLYTVTFRCSSSSPIHVDIYYLHFYLHLTDRRMDRHLATAQSVLCIALRFKNEIFVYINFTVSATARYIGACE